jgi:hypothetical protein
MQATLDVEFMAQTLNNYTTERAGRSQSDIYVLLDARTDDDARKKLQRELQELRSILKRLREGTRTELYGSLKVLAERRTNFLQCMLQATESAYESVGKARERQAANFWDGFTGLNWYCVDAGRA